MVLKYKNNSINKFSSCKFTSPGEHYLSKSTFSTIMPNTRRHSYDLNFKLKIVAEAEAVNNNREIAREYRISESMVRKWRNQQDILFSGELKMTAKRASMGHYRPKDPELDQLLADWFSDQRSQGKQMPILVIPFPCTGESLVHCSY